MNLAAAKTDTDRRPGPARADLPDPGRVKAAKKRLIDAEQTPASWAAANGEPRGLVYKVLSGTRACVSGDSLRIAIKLGIRDDLPTPEAANG